MATPAAYSQSVGNLPIPGTLVMPTDAYIPLLLKGMRIHPENPLRFDFILDTGDTSLDEERSKEESLKLIKYFLTAMTVPQNELWVNLSPYQKDRIMPDGLAITDLGGDLLAQDYLLKQLTAALMYPEEKIGAMFWEKIYQKAKEKYHTTDIPIETFNKVWIIPQSASVYEHQRTVYVVNSKLKVLLESDYLALERSDVTTTKPREETTTTKIIREIIIPEIEKEVNSGQNFAPLRQIYQSLILAKWYKEVLKNSVLSKVYVDQNKTRGIEGSDSLAKEKIYSQYMDAYKRGVYNYMKKEYDPSTQEIIPRKYFSGGFKDEAIVIERENVNSAMHLKPAGNYLESVVELEGMGINSDSDNAILSNRGTLEAAFILILSMYFQGDLQGGDNNMQRNVEYVAVEADNDSGSNLKGVNPQRKRSIKYFLPLLDFNNGLEIVGNAAKELSVLNVKKAIPLLEKIIADDEFDGPMAFTTSSIGREQIIDAYIKLKNGNLDDLFDINFIVKLFGTSDEKNKKIIRRRIDVLEGRVPAVFEVNERKGPLSWSEKFLKKFKPQDYPTLEEIEIEYLMQMYYLPGHISVNHISQIVAIGKPAVPYLIEEIREDRGVNSHNRNIARVQTLGLMGFDAVEGLPALILLLESKVPYLRLEVVRAIKATGVSMREVVHALENIILDSQKRIARGHIQDTRGNWIVVDDYYRSDKWNRRGGRHHSPEDWERDVGLLKEIMDEAHAALKNFGGGKKALNIVDHFNPLDDPIIWIFNLLSENEEVVKKASAALVNDKERSLRYLKRAYGPAKGKLRQRIRKVFKEMNVRPRSSKESYPFNFEKGFPSQIGDDNAMPVREAPGGIDMNNIDVDRQGVEIDIDFDPAMVSEMMNVGGFVPVIISTTPLESIFPFLGLAFPEKHDREEISQGISVSINPRKKRT